MADDFKTYLDKINFEKYLEKLNIKLKDKKIIVYGAGVFFNYIKENFDLTKLNIVGISDMKFTEENKEYLGYKAIPKTKIKDYEPDYVLVAVLKYVNIIEDFELNLFKNTKIKVLPIAKMPFFELVKTVWS